MDAVLITGNSSFKSIKLESSVGNPKSVQLDATGMRVGSNFLDTNFVTDYKGNEILFKHMSHYSDRSTNYLRLKLKERGIENNPSYTQHFQDKSGTIALLENLSVASVLRKAVFTIIFELDEDRNKTYHDEPLYNNVGELFLKGEFMATLRTKITSDYNYRFNSLKCMPKPCACRKI